MSAGVNNFFGCVSVREMSVSAHIAKTELQHRHSGDIEALAEFRAHLDEQNRAYEADPWGCPPRGEWSRPEWQG